MNRESQKRKILRFLKGKGRKDLDAFCIYQWIDRCHFEGWWDLAVSLGSAIPPNSLGQDYHKRLEFLLNENRKNLEDLKSEFVRLKTPRGKAEFLIPKTFWKVCDEFGLKLGGNANSSLRLDLASQKILFIQKMGLNSCVFRFCNMDSDKLNSWLNSHGFGHLTGDIQWQKNPGKRSTARLKISWHDAENLIPSIVAEAQSDGAVLMGMFFEAISAIENGNWGSYVKYVKETYSVNFPHEEFDRIRNVLINLFTEHGGSEDFLERLRTN